MDSPQANQAGSSKSGGAAMKRCPYCGAKNKSTFEYCVRCAEPLDEFAPEGVIAQSRATLGKLLVGASLGLLALLAFALMTRAVRQAPTPAVSHAMALQLFEEVTQKIPHNAMAFRYLGLSNFREENYDDALDALDEARGIQPNSYRLLDDFVTIAKQAGEPDRAIEALRDYVARNPDERGARLELARLARSSGDEEEAMAQAEYLKSGASEDPELAYEYGITLKEAGRLDEAKAALRSSVELNPDSAVAQHALGVTELVSGDAKGAIAPLEAAVARDPDNGDFRFSLAQAYEKSDRIPESLSAYEAYLEHASPDDARAKVVRERLAIAKETLAKRRKQQSQNGESE
jgi:tetratricopeptide (TPR) repeat protein